MHLVVGRLKDADDTTFRDAPSLVLFPDNAHKEWTRRKHDGDVGNQPVAVVFLQGLENLAEERVMRHGAHDIIRDTGWGGLAYEGGDRKQRVETVLATIVKIDVDAAIIGKNEVTHGVSTLNWVLVSVIGVEEPGVLLLHELARSFIGPEDVLVVWMEVDAALLAFAPVLGDILGFVGLVDDLGDQLGPRGRVLGRVQIHVEQRILERVVDSERKEVERQVEQNHDCGDVRVDEILELAAHGVRGQTNSCGVSRRELSAAAVMWGNGRL